MGSRFIKRLTSGLLPVLLLLILLLVSLHLISGAIQTAPNVNRLYTWLLIFNGVGLITLFALIANRVLRLWRQYRSKAPGSRLTLRMVMLFLLLSLTPVSIVYYYSNQFLHRGIDVWMDVHAENAIEGALKLTKTALSLRTRERLHQTGEILAQLERAPEASIPILLDQLRTEVGAQELAVIAHNSQILAYSHIDPSVIVPDLPADELLSRVRHSGSYAGLEPRADGSLLIRALTRTRGEPSLILQAIYPVTERLVSLADTVQTDYTRYREFYYLRQPLRDTFVMTLQLVLLFSVLAAVWAAFYTARRLTRPIRVLAAGTRAVAEGNYDKQLPLPRMDDLGFLVRSFNAMTRRIAHARDQAERSQNEVEQQRAYLETVLSRLSSGVLTIDTDEQLRTFNQAACDILKIDLQPFINAPIVQLATRHPHLQGFVDQVRENIAQAREWRDEITVMGSGGRQILLCQSAVLAGTEQASSGQVLVLDDITATIQAQSDAAWGEVARRLAHEIKNPLTPIQLAAERLQHKLHASLDDHDAEMLERSTRTIVHQVENMKEMVNAFSEYARMPKMQQMPVDINRLLTDTVDLYRAKRWGVDIETALDPSSPTVEADPGRLRQVFHNLVGNAIDATHATEAPRLRVATSIITSADARFVELRIEDNGPGFADAVREQAFEPYVTTKGKGTGLGLAIVKKIVEEHGGLIWIDDSSTGGCIVIQLPMTDTITTPYKPAGTAA